MDSHLVELYFINLQNTIYCELNVFSKSNKIAGRFCSIPISLLDVGLETLKTPLSAIEFVAMAAINLIGAAFSTEYTLKDALLLTGRALDRIATIPTKLVMAPIKIAFQLFAIIINPEKVQSINSQNPTFKSELNHPSRSGM